MKQKTKKFIVELSKTNLPKWIAYLILGIFLLILAYIAFFKNQLSKVELGPLKAEFKNIAEKQKPYIPEDITKEVNEITKSDAKKAIELYEKISKEIFGIDVYKVMTYNYFFIGGKYDESIGEVKKVLSTANNKNDSVWAYNNWGAALLNLGRNEEAIEKLQKAVEINPKYGGAYSNWGVALVKLGRNKEAIEKFQKAVEINPNFSEAYVVLAMLNTILNQKDEAIKNLKKAIELDPKNKEKAKTDKDFDNLRNDPEFKKLISD